MSTTNILDLNNRIDALEKISHNVEPIQQQIDELKAWTYPGTKDATGNPITLTDGSARKAEGLSVTCNPKQNLHGYDHPWAGGAGKNKLPMTVDGIKAANTAGTWDGNEYTLKGVKWTILTDSDNNVIGIKTNGTSSVDWNNFELFNDAISAGSYIVSGITGGSVNTYRMIVNQTGQTEVVLYGNEQLISVSSGDTIRIRLSIRSAGYIANNIIFYPMIRLASVSDATFEPYTNECPITGLSECVVDRDSKNLLPMVLADIKSWNTNGTWSGNAYTLNGVTFTVQTDADDNVTGFKVNGTATSSVAYLRLYSATYASNIFKGYKLNGCTGGANTTYSLTASYSNNGSTWANESHEYDGDLTISSDYDYVRFEILVRENQSVSNKLFYPMLRLASVSDATFEPYSHYTATITLGTTVYGGSVDFKTGKVTVTHASIASYNGESINEPWLSSIDEYVSGTTPTTGAQVVYPLTEPTVLTLTPAELELLKGYNYITTNGTTIELTYMPDTLKADILLTVSQLYGSKISIFDGILTGGDTGQVLTKTSDDNYDATWATLPATRTTTRKTTKEEK